MTEDEKLEIKEALTKLLNDPVHMAKVHDSMVKLAKEIAEREAEYRLQQQLLWDEHKHYTYY